MNSDRILQVSTELNEALAAVIERVQRSLVSIQNGHQGAGAGIIWHREGLILSNNHVVGRSGRSEITFYDGSVFFGKLLSRKPEFDLALLQVEARDLPVAAIADSHDLRVGQLVLALGHPWGQRNFVTAGIVSALTTAATPGGNGSIPIVRTDVTLAPGNSGGPLVNTVGGVIGINTMIVGGDQGVAIPSHVASHFVAETLERIQSNHPVKEAII